MSSRATSWSTSPSDAPPGASPMRAATSFMRRAQSFGHAFPMPSAPTSRNSHRGWWASSGAPGGASSRATPSPSPSIARVTSPWRRSYTRRPQTSVMGYTCDGALACSRIGGSMRRCASFMSASGLRTSAASPSFESESSRRCSISAALLMLPAVITLDCCCFVARFFFSLAKELISAFRRVAASASASILDSSRSAKSCRTSISGTLGSHWRSPVRRLKMQSPYFAA